MKRIRHFLLLSALTLCLTVAAAAADFDGYLVQIDTPVRLLDASAPDLPEMNEVYAPLGLYQAGDAATVERLRQCGVLLHAEPNYIVTLDDTPDIRALHDVSGKARLWDASETAEKPWYESELGMAIVRQNGVTGAGVRVGIVDSGIFKEHQAFEGVKVLDGANYCVPADDEARHDVSDSVGHGTFVSGLIAAAGNGTAPAGLAPDVELVPLKCFESKSGSIANIASAIYDSVDTWECQILNLSLGIEKDSTVLRKAIEYAGEKGVLMVAAAGNLLSGQHNPNGDPLNYPAAYPQVIGVGAVGKSLSVASFSYRNESVEVVAPGQNMRAPSSKDKTAYVSGYGTSYASPIVAAAAALTLSVRPELTPADFREFLTSTVRDLGDEGYDTSYGHGLLQIGTLCATANPEKFPEPLGKPESIFQRVLAERQRVAEMEGDTPALFAAAYSAAGQLLHVLDISPTTSKDGESDTTPKDGESDTTPKDGESDTTPKDGESDTTPKDGESDTTPKDGESDTTPKDGESDTTPKDRESDTTPTLSGTDLSEEMFQIDGAALWKLISFDRLTFAPVEVPVIISVS